MDNQLFSEKLDEALRKKGMTQKRLAENIGWSDRHLSRLKKGSIKYEQIKTIADTLGLDIGFFIGQNSEDEGYFKVPFRKARGAMGGGCASGSRQVVSHMSFKFDWLMTKTTNPENLSIIRAVGESMLPTISPDSMVLIDEGQIDPVNGKIFYLMLNDEYYLKRIQSSSGHVKAIISDNGGELLEILESDRLEILGRAIIQVNEL